MNLLNQTQNTHNDFPRKIVRSSTNDFPVKNVRADSSRIDDFPTITKKSYMSADQPDNNSAVVFNKDYFDSNQPPIDDKSGESSP